MGSGNQTGKSEVVKHLCGRRQGRREVSKFFGTSAIQQANCKKVWENECRKLTKHGGKMRGSTKAQTCRGGYNAKEWWDTSTAFSALAVKVGLGAMLFRTKLKAARPK